MGLKIKVHFTFYIFLFFVVYFGGFLSLFLYFVSLSVHELTHHFVSKSGGVVSQTIYLTPYGLSINVNCDNKNNFEKFLIFFSGPFINIFISLLCVAVWWLFPITYYYLKSFAFINISLGLFNLIPIVPLDGGNIFLLFFNNKSSKRKVIKVMKICSVVFAFIFLSFFIVSLFYEVNFSCFCISFFLFSSALSSQISFNELKSFLPNKIKECKIYVVGAKVKVSEMQKYFDKSKFVQFYIINDENKIVKIMSQDDVAKLL